MARFSQWSFSHGLKVLAVVFTVGAVVDALLGHWTPAIISAVLAVAILERDRSRHARSRADS
jgi:hypothetical protein